MDHRLSEFEPGKRVVWQVIERPPEWVGTKINFDLRQEGDDCVVTFQRHGRKKPVEFMHHCSTNWDIFLMNLKSLAEAGKGKPSPDIVTTGDLHRGDCS